MRKEKSRRKGSWWILERRIGWRFWRVWREDWRWGISGGFERSKPRTVVPVPPGTARHQLCSVPPTGRDLDSPAGGGGD